jgi:hypothetical protein
MSLTLDLSNEQQSSILDLSSSGMGLEMKPAGLTRPPSSIRTSAASHPSSDVPLIIPIT